LNFFNSFFILFLFL